MATVRSLSLALALVATGLLAGFFYAYSSSVSLGLGELDDRGYVAAMQAINDSIPNGVFVLSFVGAPLLLIVATALHAASHSPRLAPLLLAGGLVIGGGLLVTFLANVPLNDDLAGVDPNAGQEVLARARADYEDPWNTWNAVRTITCTAALASLAWALRLPASRPTTAA
jgi:uncharacterized membrane protein